jgi:hypothetical protein
MDNQVMKYEKHLVIQTLLAKEIRKSNSSIKKTITQLDGIIDMNEEILSKKDYKALVDTKDVLLKLITKRSSYANKAELKDKKISKIKLTLKKKIDKYDEKKRLACILAVNLEAFKYFSPTLDEAYDDFLDICAKRLESNKMTVTEFLTRLDETLEKVKSNEEFLSQMKIRTQQFGI